jgi:hypothetical protein
MSVSLEGGRSWLQGEPCLSKYQYVRGSLELEFIFWVTPGVTEEGPLAAYVQYMSGS